jgi:lysyl-tRNA synthetase class 2
MADSFHFVPGYQHYVYGAGREPLFFLLLAFLLTFVAVRTYTRLGRMRGWGSGSLRGVHLHHLLPGIIASLAAGTAIIAFRPGDDSMLLLSALFGVGSALTLDEFALLLHLDDVYWTAEGRSSIEAALMGFTLAALCLLATAPLGSDPGKDVPHWVLGGIISLNMAFALVSFLKGKAKLGAFGIFLPGLAILGAARLAKPSSLWARRFYTGAKFDRSRARAALQHGRYEHVKLRLYDAIGGTPHLERRVKN